MAEEKDSAAADVPADVTIGDAELEEMGLDDVDETELTETEKVAEAAAKARPSRKSAADSDSEKKHTGRKRTNASDPEHKRANPVQFTREAIAELKKVVWPTWPQLQQYFVVVLVFVLIMIAIVFLLDLGLGAAVLKLFG